MNVPSDKCNSKSGLSFEILDTVDKTEWNTNLAKSKYVNFFQTAEYISQKSNSDRFPQFTYILDENKQVLAQLGIIVVKKVDINISKALHRVRDIFSKISSRAFFYCGPVIHDERRRIEILVKILEALDEVARRNKIVFIEGYTSQYDPLVNSDFLNEIKTHGFGLENMVTFVIDLSKNPDELWNDVARKARGDINRGERRKITIKELKTYDELKNYMLMNQQWGKTKGFEIDDPFKYLDKMWHEHESGIKKTFFAYDGSELVSVLSLGCFNGIAFTDQVKNLYSENANLAGTCLTWHGIQWAKENGFRLYDMSGGFADHDVESLLFYKEKFGGSKIPYYRLKKVRSKYSYKLYSFSYKAMVLFLELKTKKQSVYRPMY
jgi:hypothetical protein